MFVARYPTAAVVPAYAGFPYAGKRPFAALRTRGGRRYVTMRAGEGFSFTLTFTKPGKTAKVLTGTAPTTLATRKVPAGYRGGSVAVRLVAETNAARTSAVTLAT